MATSSLPQKYPSLRRKPARMIDYTGSVECMNTLNNNIPTIPTKKQVEAFAKWFHKIIDEDRETIGLYFAEDIVLQWFGRTIKEKKYAAGFLKYDMHRTSHDFVSVKPCAPFALRGENNEDVKKSNKKSKTPEELAVPIAGITPMNIIKSLALASSKSLSGKRTRSVPSSPENTLKKKLKTLTDRSSTEIVFNRCNSEETLLEKITSATNNTMKYELRSLYKKKNANFSSGERLQVKKVPIDQMNTTSRKGSLLGCSKTTSSLSLLPRNYAEIECVLRFSKQKSRKNLILYEWERQCTLQVAFSENPDCKGEYIIWKMLYTDNNKCRRNLLADFDAIAKDESRKK